MRKWESPIVSELGIDKTFVVSDYITTCNWNEAETLDLGNQGYKDPNKKPEGHDGWVWCKVHDRWHPVHKGETNGPIDGIIS